MTHTPGPWRAMGMSIWENDGDAVLKMHRLIANTNANNPEAVNLANAQHIVHCVNTMPSLILMLETIKEALEDQDDGMPARMWIETVASLARQAIAVAKGAAQS